MADSIVNNCCCNGAETIVWLSLVFMGFIFMYNMLGKLRNLIMGALCTFPINAKYMKFPLEQGKKNFLKWMLSNKVMWSS